MKSLKEFKNQNQELEVESMSKVLGGQATVYRDTTYGVPSTGDSGCDHQAQTPDGFTLVVGDDWNYAPCDNNMT